MIIGIAGKKGIGKTTVANVLCSRKGYVRVAFADPLKAMLKSLLLDVGLTDGAHHYHSVLNKEAEIHQLGVSYRHLAQSLGTEWRDMVCSNIWGLCAEKKIKEIQGKGFNIVIDDVRFEHEAALIRSKGGIIVHLRGCSPIGHDPHTSEQGIMVLDNDLVVHSIGNINDVMDRLEGFIACIG